MQIVSQLAHLVATIAEHNHLLGSLQADQVVQQFVFVVAGDQIDDLLDRVSGNTLGLDFDHHRIHGPARRQFQNFWRKSRTEQQGLTAVFVRGARHDVANLRDKTHIQHAIGLINNQQLNQPEIQMFILEKIDQTARRRHHNIDGAFVDCPQLFLIILTTHQGYNAQVTVFAQISRIIGNLNDQLPCRRQHQSPWFAGVALFGYRILKHVIDQRDQECRCFAGAGLGLASHVITNQCITQTLGLDWRAILKTKIADGFGKWFCQIKTAELYFGGRLFCGRLRHCWRIRCC